MLPHIRNDKDLNERIITVILALLTIENNRTQLCGLAGLNNNLGIIKNHILVKQGAIQVSILHHPEI